MDVGAAEYAKKHRRVQRGGHWDVPIFGGQTFGCTEVKKKNLKKGKEDGWSNGFQSIDPID